MASVWTRRGLVTATIGLAGMGGVRTVAAGQESLPVAAGPIDTTAGQRVTWQPPWQATRHDVYETGTESLILESGNAIFALVTHVLANLDPARNTPAGYREMVTSDADQNDVTVIEQFDDAKGAHLLTQSEDDGRILYYCYSEPVVGFLVEMGFYAPLLEFASKWDEARGGISLNDASLFTGFDESKIVAPVIALAESADAPATPIASDSARDYLSAVWTLHDNLDQSSAAAHDAAEHSDPFSDAILDVLAPDVESWHGIAQTAETLESPIPAFEPVQLALLTCTDAYVAAADTFAAISGTEDLGRSASWSEFTTVWNDADDQLQALEDVLSTWEKP